ESVTISHSGTSTSPIIFQSVTWHGAVMTHSTAYTLFQPSAATVQYITLRGINFSQTPFRNYSGFNDWPNSVYVFDNWRMEDCVGEKNMGVGWRNFNGDVADNVTVLRTVFQNCYINAAGGAGNNDTPRIQGGLLQNVIFRRNNQMNLSPGGYAGANKFLW